MDRYFEKLYAMAQNDDKIIDFSIFCKEIHNFGECDIENFVVEFFTEMLRLYLQKYTSVKKRREFFINHGLEWQNFFFLLEKYNNEEYYLNYIKKL